ncbi:hypothetical protein NONO_c73280 [Nocardia nova SH22a]|uniref:Uncharacterized protein n=1 Tax=Nocardia nova SH22a TaxID=1415166 RepID=W5TSE4_9NOCA|nr:hypothetical protein [Nocardia nova]AHH22084.1 hypothetical protein NONO_c73280 [Nocardia nova SH22a]
MRIRSIKPEFWRSDDIDVLDWHHRLVFIGLWSYVDDNGVGLDKLASICADLFASDLERDPRETFARVSEALQTFADRGLIQRYSVDGKAYLFITGWQEHQRIDKPGKARYPLPTSRNAEILETVATPSRDIRETPAPGTEEQGNRGKEEKTCSSAAPTNDEPPAAASKPNAPQGFDDFWNAYPRRQAKGAAIKAWAKAVKRASPREIVDGASRFAADPNRDPAFTAMPATWLNADRWDDDPLPSRPGNVSTHAQEGPQWQE